MLLAALELSKGRDVQYAAGLALAVAGDYSRSQSARRAIWKSASRKIPLRNSATCRFFAH